MKHANRNCCARCAAKATCSSPARNEASRIRTHTGAFAGARRGVLPRPLPVQVFAVDRGQSLWPRTERAPRPGTAGVNSDTPPTVAPPATAPNLSGPPRHDWAAGALTRVVAQVRLSDGAVVTFRHTL